jgi:nifR3 family TIM-barrel protein
MDYWNSQLTIGSRSLGRFIGSPLDGVTNVPFRKTVRLFSPEVLMYTEICHCDTIVNRDPRHWGLEVGEPQINFQMTTADASYVVPACERVLAHGVSMVDINIGCPAKTVINKGAGSALMADPLKLKAIIQLFRAHLPVPLTVKMRAGFKDYSALDIALMLQDLGVDAICVHPRLQSQGFTGVPDYALVAQIKKVLSIPVLVSGGIISWPKAKDVYEETGVDGFLIGRALLGSPWLLQQLTVESQGGTCTISNDQIVAAMMQHLEYAIDWLGPSRGLAYFKKHFKEYAVRLGLSKEQSITLLACPCPHLFKNLWSISSNIKRGDPDIHAGQDAHSTILK